MTYEEKFQKEVLDEVLQWSAAKIYSVFGSFIETIVTRKREEMQLKLKTVWRNRMWYAFKDTGTQFEKDTMLLYFCPKKISKYTLSELETIIEKLEAETVYSNPKKGSRRNKKQ